MGRRNIRRCFHLLKWCPNIVIRCACVYIKKGSKMKGGYGGGKRKNSLDKWVEGNNERPLIVRRNSWWRTKWTEIDDDFLIRSDIGIQQKVTTVVQYLTSFFSVGRINLSRFYSSVDIYLLSFYLSMLTKLIQNRIIGITLNIVRSRFFGAMQSSFHIVTSDLPPVF